MNISTSRLNARVVELVGNYLDFKAFREDIYKTMKWQLHQAVGTADIIEVLLKNFKEEIEKMHEGLLIRLSLH